MASKIHTDNPKHHKYVTTNKKERKKNKINIVFNHINKIYNLIYEHITNQWLLIYHNKYFREGKQSIYHGVKGCKIIYDDCNHKTYRVYNIKKHKFINTLDKSRGYGHFCFTPKHFKMK